MSKISETRRQEILSAAAAEFGSRGVETVSIAEIASRAGLGKSTIYEYFPSKADLFASVCEIKMQETAASFQEIFSQSIPFREKLIDYADNLIRTLRSVEMDPFLLVFVTDPAAAVLRKNANALLERATARISDAVRQAQIDGELSVDLDATVTARYLLALPNPQMLHFLKGCSERPAELIVDMILNGLRQPYEEQSDTQQPDDSAS